MKVSVRVAAAVAGVLVGALGLAGVAAAHVEVSAKPARALATDAIVSFDAEAESSKSGIKSVRVVLPEGIAPADVTLTAGPSGWTLTPTTDGFTVAGTALAVGKNAVYSIKVRQLPDATSIAFKTLVNYTDGQVDRWIEIPKPGEKAPEHPAPVLKLAPAAVTTASAVVTASPSAATSAPAPAVSTSVAAAAADSGSSTGVWLAVGGGVLAVAVVLLIALRRRSTP